MNGKCEYCNGSLGEFIHLNSFYYKCLSCRKVNVATSYESIREHLEGNYEVLISDESLNEQILIGTGNIEVLLTQIDIEVSSGKLIHLKRI